MGWTTEGNAKMNLNSSIREQSGVINVRWWWGRLPWCRARPTTTAQRRPRRRRRRPSSPSWRSPSRPPPPGEAGGGGPPRHRTRTPSRRPGGTTTQPAPWPSSSPYRRRRSACAFPGRRTPWWRNDDDDGRGGRAGVDGRGRRRGRSVEGRERGRIRRSGRAHTWRGLALGSPIWVHLYRQCWWWPLTRGGTWTWAGQGRADWATGGGERTGRHGRRARRGDAMRCMRSPRPESRTHAVPPRTRSRGPDVAVSPASRPVHGEWLGGRKGRVVRSGRGRGRAVVRSAADPRKWSG